MSISLLNVVKYYKGEANQEKALKILQAELEKTNPELLSETSEFIKIWKTPDAAQAGNPVAAAASIVAANTAISATSLTVSTIGSDTSETTTAVAVAKVSVSKTFAQTVKLEVPYLSQLDNEQNPHGSCNVTSVSMCLGYFGHPLKNDSGEQLEDELYSYCLNHSLSRHSPTDLAKVVEIYGYKDDFQPDANWGDVKQWLAAGNPCIVHGWFSRSGHIIVIVGYNEKGWIVNDPYGEWYEWGYDTSVSGKGLTYSYGMMKEVCGSDGDLWIHYISK